MEERHTFLMNIVDYPVLNIAYTSDYVFILDTIFLHLAILNNLVPSAVSKMNKKELRSFQSSSNLHKLRNYAKYLQLVTMKVFIQSIMFLLNIERLRDLFVTFATS